MNNERIPDMDPVQKAVISLNDIISTGPSPIIGRKDTQNIPIHIVIVKTKQYPIKRMDALTDGIIVSDKVLVIVSHFPLFVYYNEDLLRE